MTPIVDTIVDVTVPMSTPGLSQSSTTHNIGEEALTDDEIEN